MINIVCALRCEAKPLIKRLRLQASSDTPVFPLFIGEQVRLIISGHSKSAAAAAVGYLLGKFSCENDVWLNLGIAGSGSAPVGELLWIKKVIDHSKQQTYFPVATFEADIAADSLMTLDRPEEHYHQPLLYDMEGSAFFEAASRATTAEWVHLLKVVSDNADEPAQQVSAKQAEALLEKHTDRILSFIEKLLAAKHHRQSDVDITPLLQQLQQKWHLSNYQQKQLQRYLHRAQALQLNIDQLQEFDNSKPALQWLQEKLEHAELIL